GQIGDGNPLFLCDLPCHPSNQEPRRDLLRIGNRTDALNFLTHSFQAAAKIPCYRRGRAGVTPSLLPSHYGELANVILKFTQHTLMNDGIGDHSLALVHFGFTRLELWFYKRDEFSGLLQQSNG